MSIWELKTQPPDEFAPLVPSDAQVRSGLFEFDGTPTDWKRRPPVEVYREGPKKKWLPRGDASLMLAGSLVLNQKAADALGPFLLQFGQLLEAKVDGVVEYFYNVTRVIDCIDLEKSERRSSGSISKEAFRADALPVAPTVFKDSKTALNRIYVNNEAKKVLDEAITAHQLTGFDLAPLARPSTAASRSAPGLARRVRDIAPVDTPSPGGQVGIIDDRSPNCTEHREIPRSSLHPAL